MKITEHEVTFEFPYTIGGGEAATFDCKASVRVDWGQRPIMYPPPGDPGYGPEVEEITDLKVDIGKYDAKSKKWNHEWATPDPALARKIYDWLGCAGQQSWLIDKAREDKAA